MSWAVQTALPHDNGSYTVVSQSCTNSLSPTWSGVLRKQLDIQYVFRSVCGTESRAVVSGQWALCCLCKRYSDVRKPQQAHINYADHSCCPSGWTNLSGRISCYSVSPWETMEHKSPTSLASPPVSVGMINRLSWNIKKLLACFSSETAAIYIFFLFFFISVSLLFSSPQPNWWIDHSFSHSS